MQDIERLALIVKVAQLYYEYHQTQQKIASFLNLSRPTVSRLLKEGIQEGIIQINVVNPLEGFSVLETRLEELFNLKKVIVIPNFNCKPQEIKKRLGERAAKYLHSIVRDGDIIATSWGTTLHEVAQSISPKRVRGVKVVQCNGGVGRSNVNAHANEIMNRISQAFNALSFFLLSPAIVEDRQIAELLQNESSSKEIFHLQQAANIAIFGIGIPTDKSILVEAGYFTTKEMIDLKKKGAVGDICSRYFDINGEICDPDLDARTVSLKLETLLGKPYSIAVAGSEAKADAIIGACNGGYVNILITDEAAAEEVLSRYVDPKPQKLL